MDRISAVVKSQSNTTLTLAQVWQIDSLIVNKAYQISGQASQQANLYDTEVNHTESLTQVLYQLWHTRSHNNQNTLSNTCAERLVTCPLNLQQALLLGFAKYFPDFLPGHLHVHPRALANALTQSPIAVRDWILGATTLTLDTHVTLDDTVTPHPLSNALVALNVVLIPLQHSTRSWISNSLRWFAYVLT